MGGAPSTGGMSMQSRLATPGGGTGQGKYNMVAPPTNLMMEHSRLMDENQVDGQGMQMLADAPQENRHGADYFQRDDHDKYENYDRASGKRRFRDGDDFDGDRGRGGRGRDRDDSRRDGRGGGGGRRGRLAFTEEDDGDGGDDGGGAADRAGSDAKANAAVIAARLEAKLKAKQAQNPHVPPPALNVARSAADLLKEPPCVMVGGPDKHDAAPPAARPPVPSFAAPAPPSKPPVPNFAVISGAPKLELTFGGAPLRPADGSPSGGMPSAPAPGQGGVGASYDPSSAGDEDDSPVAVGGGARAVGKTGASGSVAFGFVDRGMECI